MTKKEIKCLKGKRSLLGSLELLSATLVWGYGYIVIRNAFSAISLNALMTWRYLIAFVLLLLLFVKHLRFFSRRVAIEGIILGLLLYFGQYFQTFALAYKDTTAGKVAFITALYVVLVPFLNWLVFRKKPGKWCLLSICLAIPGLFLLTCTNENGIGTGDVLALIGSLGFSVHILAIDLFTERDDTILLTILQFGSAAFFAGVVQLLSGTGLGGNIWKPSVMGPLIYLGVFSTMVGFLMQFLGQKNLTPEVSAVLLATESVFGMLFSALLLGEHLTIWGKTGCVLMLAAVLLAEQKPNKTSKTK